MSYIKKFPLKGTVLSQEDKKVLQILTEATELIASLYVAQRNPKYPGGNFYPSDASREEIQEAAKKNPEILSPYTFVERTHSGELIAIPYSKKFKKEFTRIARLLREAAGESPDKAFGAYLRARAEDLFHDNFDKSNILWLRAPHSKIGFVLGPFDRDLDKLFFVKRSFKAYLGILDTQQTKKMEQFRAAILAARKKYLPGAQQVDISRMYIRVEDSMAIAGSDADSLFLSDNLPSSADLYVIKKYGMISTIFKPVVELRFTRWIFPIYKQVFSPNLPHPYSREEIQRALLLVSTFGEISHVLMRYEDAAPRLQEFFPYFDEVYTEVVAMRISSLLFLKGALTERELEAIILAEICQGVYYLELQKKRPQLRSFATGYAVLFDFLLEGQALKQENRGFSIDLQRVFLVLDNFSQVFEYYLSLASRDEAKEFFARFQPEQALKKFTSLLPKVFSKKEKLP